MCPGVREDAGWLFIMRDTIVFIDGGYLSLISKFLGKGKPLIFDINKFAKSIATKQKLNLSKVIYYTAPPYESPKPTKSEISKKSKYQKFVNKLGQIPNFMVREGRCQKIDNIFQQKGVDTLNDYGFIKNRLWKRS